MSTASTYKSSVENGVFIGEREDTPVLHSYGHSFTLTDGIEFQSFKKARTSKNVDPVSTKRRLKGFLIEMEPEEARVCLIENGERFFYDLPSDQLRKAGITHQNQPFEMDEIEMKIEDGGFVVGYRFKPLARPEHAYIESLKVDDERKRKRDLILKAFAKPKS
jgi:hypothetical protein